MPSPTKHVHTFACRKHYVELWTGKTRSGWIWWLRIDSGSLHKCTCPLPDETLAIREGTIVARAEVDNLEEPSATLRALADA